MEFPDFEEFRKTLSEEKMSDFFGGHMLNIYQIENMNQENINALISKIAFDIMVRSATYSLNLLESYHEWLQSQI